MPNYVKNELVAYNLGLEAKTRLEVAFGHDDPFQRILPMPSVLENTQAPPSREFFRIFGMKYPAISQGFNGQEHRRKLIDYGVRKAIDKIQKDEYASESDKITSVNTVRALVKTGFFSWYDWRLEKWGVKWDAAEIQMSSETWFKEDEPKEPDFTVRFVTAWAAPEGILQRLTEQYPDAKFILRYADSDDICCEKAAGILAAEGGIIDKSGTGDFDIFMKKLFHFTDEQWKSIREEHDC